MCPVGSTDFVVMKAPLLWQFSNEWQRRGPLLESVDIVICSRMGEIGRHMAVLRAAFHSELSLFAKRNVEENRLDFYCETLIKC